MNSFAGVVDFSCEIAALQADEAIACTILFQEWMAPAPKVFQWGYRPGNNAVKFPVLNIFCTRVGCSNICKTQFFRYRQYYFYFFPDTVDHVEMRLWKADGERNARKATTAPQVHKGSMRQKRKYFCYSQRVEDMMDVKAVHIFSGDYINLLVPVSIQVF